MINVHGIRRNVKNVVRNYTDAQVKVREATSNDPWGPSSTLMSEIADLTYNVVAFTEIMQMIWKRLNDHGKNWRHVYKALVLLEYMIKTGSEKVAQQCKENIFAIQTLKDFQYIEDNKDQGINVREKSKQLVVLLKDDERLRNERARALKAKERFAQSSSHVGNEPLDREVPGYQDGIHSPTSASTPKELESTRPQTAGEEELQLQLALAMSKEEAEMEERLRRNDDLRLQMAISESQTAEELKKPSSREEGGAGASSSMDDLLGLNVGGATAAAPRGVEQRQLTLDPWGMPIQPSVVSPAQSPDPWTQHANRLPTTSDPWTTGRPVSTPPRPMTSSSSSNDPWSPSNVASDLWSSGGRNAPATSASMDFLCGTGGHTNGDADDFDLLSQRSGITNKTGNSRSSPSPFDLQPLENSLQNDMLTADNNNYVSAVARERNARKTPETFLGANSNLVNLDALVSSKSLAAVGATNPFTLSSATPSGNQSAVFNPFQAAKPPPPSINELRAQNQKGEFVGQQHPQPLLPNHDMNIMQAPSYTTLPASNPFL